MPVDVDGHVAKIRQGLSNYEVRQPLVYHSAEQAESLATEVADADLIVVGESELLAIPWAAKALLAAAKPIVLYCRDKYLSAPLADLAGCLAADGADASMAVDMSDVRTRAKIVAAEKAIRNGVLLVVGDGFPSCSQAANPSSPDVVTERFGTRVVVRTTDDFYAALAETSRTEAEALAQEWIEWAYQVTDGARQTLVEAAQTHLVIERFVEATGATGVAVDCRAIDETSMERFGVFYSPCVSLTVLRDRGIPAACEADVCCALGMMVLGEVAGKPAFMGNLPTVDVEQGWLHIAHCAATTKMDGYEAAPAPLTLEDYHGRKNGVASYAPFREGETVTVARPDKNLRRVSLVAGPIVDADLKRQLPGCINIMRLGVSDPRDYVHRCLMGDHHAVVYGDMRAEVRELAGRLGLEVVEPRT
jgi:L-fucose isomerase-like protein